MRGRATITSFKKGCAPGPGRPKGARDRVPRGSVKAAYETFVAARGGQAKIVDAIERGIRDPRRSLGFLELYAKVLKEIGAGSDDGGAPGIILLSGGLDVRAFRQAAGRAQIASQEACDAQE